MADNKEVEKKKFNWSEEMLAHLLQALMNYKVQCEFSNKDFDADKTFQYSQLRKEMAKKFREGFGPESVSEPPKPQIEMTKEERQEYESKIKAENNLIGKGYNRILQKVKAIRQGFSKVLISGTRSGSHKRVYEHFDTLQAIWGGSPNAAPIAFGIDTASATNTDKSGP
eukprot:gene8482-9386_t